MQKINFDLLPPSLKSRYLALPRTVTDVPEICKFCSAPIHVKQILLGNELRYLSEKCPCRIAEEKRLEQEKIQAEILDARSRNTYTWLGRQWQTQSLREKTFENFHADRQREAYDAACMFTNDPYGALVLYGTFGTGKTHLLAAICNKALSNKQKSICSLFTTAPLLFGAIQERIGQGQDYYSILEHAVSTPLLIIDDIDKGKKHNEFREEIYFSIIDRRVIERRPTAISTNRLDELADFVGGAVCSRLKPGQIAVEMAGTDYREEL